ncbi:MAG: tetraacyldisaccharide 4'-kinase [Parvularculaceae bacterium]
MPLHEPAWWYDTSRRWPPRLLAPFGALYGRFTELRLRRAMPYTPRIPVLCVGNFTAGGTGKTPMAIALAQIVRDLDREPVFLSRGYGGKLTGAHIVDLERHTHIDTGDEPLLLARTAPTVVARDRRQGAELIERTFGPKAVLIMDDGLQNPALTKDFSIAIVDGKRGFGNGRCIPAGPLRAPLGFQAGLVQAIAINGAAGGRDARSILAPISDHFSGLVIQTHVAPDANISWLKNQKLVAFAGIANPERFFATVEKHGGMIAKRYAFADHHTFTDEDAARLIEAADKQGATLVTTEKDFVRLSGGGEVMRSLAERTRTMPVRLNFERDGRSELTDRVTAAIFNRDRAGQP